MRALSLGFLGAAIALVGILGCSSDRPTKDGSTPAGQPQRGELVNSGAVAGKIRGTTVKMAEASFAGELSIHEKGNWAQSPSLLIFLFLQEGETPDGREYVVSSKGGFSASTPHVHYRWASGDRLETAVAVNEYDMKLVFQTRENGKLRGAISFSVPGEDTSVSGSFEAVINP